MFADDPKQSVLIDFDFPGKAGEKKYPSGFVETLSDTKRHPDARAGLPLQKSHDRFSLSKVFRFFLPRDMAKETDFNEAIKKLNSETDLEIVAAQFDKLGTNLKFVEDSPPTLASE